MYCDTINIRILSLENNLFINNNNYNLQVTKNILTIDLKCLKVPLKNYFILYLPTKK